MTKKAASKRKSSSPKKDSGSGDVIKIQNVGPKAVIAAGRNAKASIVNTNSFSHPVDWVTHINMIVDALPDASKAEKEDIKHQVEKIRDEAQKGPKAEVGRLEKLINTLSVMAPDIFDVFIASLKSPLEGIGVVMIKIRDKVKLDRLKPKG